MIAPRVNRLFKCLPPGILKVSAALGPSPMSPMHYPARKVLGHVPPHFFLLGSCSLRVVLLIIAPAQAQSATSVLKCRNAARRGRGTLIMAGQNQIQISTQNQTVFVMFGPDTE